MKNNFGLKVMAALLAVAIVGSFAITTKSNNLRAMEGDEGFVEEAPAEVVQEVVVVPEPEPIPEEPAEQPAEEAPVEEPAEQPAEEPAEAEAEAEAEAGAEAGAEAEAEAEEEEPFDVVAAYQHYMSLDEYGKIEYLNSLSDANREELKRYIEMKEAEAKAAEEPKEEEKQEEPAAEPETRYLRVDYVLGEMDESGENLPCTWTADAEGLEIPAGVNFAWEESSDGGNSWYPVGGSGQSLQITLTRANINNLWRCSVTF